MPVDTQATVEPHCLATTLGSLPHTPSPGRRTPRHARNSVAPTRRFSRRFENRTQSDHEIGH